MSELTTGSDLVPAARTEGEALVISIRGEIDLHLSPELRTEVLHLMHQAQPKKLVLNIELVPYMDSSAVAVLVESAQKMRKAGGRVWLTNVQPRVRSLLEIAHLQAIFAMVANEQEALVGK